MDGCRAAVRCCLQLLHVTWRGPHGPRRPREASRLAVGGHAGI